MSFTEEVRQEAAGRPLPTAPEAGDVELAWLLRTAGSWVWSGAPPRTTVTVETSSGAVARRAFALLQARHGSRPALQVRAASGVQRTTFGVRVEDGDAALVERLGLRGPTGTRATPPVSAATVADALRGALLGGGNLSAPGRAVHLELSCRDEGSAWALATASAELLGVTPSVVTDGDRVRVVVKSGDAVDRLLEALEVPVALARWREHRERRRLRADATRLANADGANLRRSVAAAATQVAAVEALVSAHGWDGLDEELRAVALARLTSPEATLAELGELTDPPLSRSAVHRRLARLTELAGQLPSAGGGRSDGG